MNVNIDNGNTLDSLVQQLTAEERSTMLSKISPYMEENQEPPTFVNEAEKHAAITEYTEKIYNRRNFLYKLKVLLAQLFGGESKADAITRMELQSIYHDIRAHFGALIDIRSYTLTGTFLKEFVKLAKLCSETNEVLEHSLNDNEFYVKFISDILETMLNERQKVLLTEAYPTSLGKKNDIATKNDYTNEKDRRIKKYFNVIDLQSFINFNDQLKNYEILSRLIKFRFHDFFALFSVSEIDAPFSQDVSCPFNAAEELLRRLFRLVSSVTFTIDDVTIFKSLMEYYSNRMTGVGEKPFNDEAYLKISEIIDTCAQIQKRIPMRDIMACLKASLLYQVSPIVVNYDVTLIYKEYKKTMLDKIWNEYFITLKKNNLSVMTEEMFGAEYNYHSLHYLTPHFKQQMEQMNLITLPFVYKLNLCVEFLSVIYKVKIEPVVSHILNDGDFKKDKVRTELTSFYYLLSNGEQRIRDFDEKYSPNNENGKMLVQLLHQTNRNESILARFAEIINQLNINTQNLISELQQSFKYIYEFLVSVNDVHNPHNVPIVNSDKIKVSGQPNLFVAVERAITLFDKFNNMLEMVVDVYK